MRLAITVLTGVVAAGVLGCASSAAPAGSRGAPPASPVSPARVTSSPATVPLTQLDQAARNGAGAAATQFDEVYASSNFAASWDMLAASTQKEIPRTVWVAVHNRCAPTGAGSGAVVKSLTFFGNTAVVTVTMTGTASAHTAEEIFSYGAGGWHYMPNDPSIYQHPSVQADVSAAKAAGLCMTGKYF